MKKTDDDPKNPAYIATQGPLMNTSADFWQMVWEQRSVVLVNLCRSVENGTLKCFQYWPSNGFEVYGKFEVMEGSTLNLFFERINLIYHKFKGSLSFGACLVRGLFGS